MRFSNATTTDCGVTEVITRPSGASIRSGVIGTSPPRTLVTSSVIRSSSRSSKRLMRRHGPLIVIFTSSMRSLTSTLPSGKT